MPYAGNRLRAMRQRCGQGEPAARERSIGGFELLIYAYLVSLIVGGVLLGASILLGGKDLEVDADADADLDLDLDADGDLELAVGALGGGAALALSQCPAPALQTQKLVRAGVSLASCGARG